MKNRRPSVSAVGDCICSWFCACSGALQCAIAIAPRNDHSPKNAATISYVRVIVIFRNSAIRSDSGGCVLNNPENNVPAESGCTIIKAEVEGGKFIGIFLLYAPNFSNELI